MSKNEEEKLIFTKKVKKVEDLLEPGNFLYCIMKDNNNLIKELEGSQEYKSITVEKNKIERVNEIAKLEWALIPHADESIHNWERALKWYEYCALPEFKPEGEHKSNDMLTSPSFAKKYIEDFKLKEIDKYARNFLAVNHTIGNMITAYQNWKGVDVASNKIAIFWDVYKTGKHDKPSQKLIADKYIKKYSNWNDLVKNLYFQDFCSINENNEYGDVWTNLIYDNIKTWNQETRQIWLNSMTKLIIQRGYRMQLEYKDPKFSPRQKCELHKIFEFFEFDNKDVI